uniref:SPARC related modular calcium binding 1 n=1 Tax=Ciona savignyi TaxID=51511 RepID=H2ZQK3_CIOSA
IILQPNFLSDRPECEFACGGSRKRKYCGSDGTTFRNSCQVKKAKCYDPLLKVKRGKCKGTKDVCSQARTHAILSPYARYLPLCTSDGRYAPHQCYDTPPYCVCLDPEGKMIPGSAHRHDHPVITPSASSPAKAFRKLTPSSFSLTMDIFRPFPHADSCTEEHLFVLIQNIENDVLRELRTLQASRTCISEREKSLLLQSSGTNVYVPQCEGGNLFNPVQCHASAGYCWCVTTDTGHPIIGTTAGRTQPTSQWLFRYINLLTPFIQRQQPELLSTSTIAPPNRNTSPPVIKGETTKPNFRVLLFNLIYWFFELLDKNHDGMLNKRESRGMKKKLKGKIGPMRCVRRLVKSCDANKNKKIDETEFFACLGVSRGRTRVY